jgi:hypothetical protein
MFEEADCLLFHKLRNHVAEHSAYSVETLVSLADVGKSSVVQEDLLHDEDGYSFAELRARLHDAQAERNDLRSQQEVDDLSRVVLDQSANDTQASQTKILERTRLRSGVQERVEKERNVSFEILVLCPIGLES